MTFHLSSANTSSRSNNVNLIRLIAATAVTFGHCFPLLGELPAWDNFARAGLFGYVAVAVFFGLSGFLITQSFDRRKSSLQFMAARWLRIFPGLFFACLVTTILVSQFVKHQGWEAFGDIKNWRYTFGAFFFDYTYFSGVFDGQPSNGVNGSLWTLPIEFRMYLFVFVFGLAGILKRRLLFLTICGVLLGCFLLNLQILTIPLFHILFGIRDFEIGHISLPLAFNIGVLFYLFREKVPLNPWVALAAVLLNLIISDRILLALTYIYAAFVFGFHPKFYFQKLNFRSDISYGIYVLSYPVQQTLIFNKVILEPHLFFILIMMIVIPLALISWNFIEKPALTLKSKFSI